MIEAINRNIERERSKLKVNVEYWNYPINEKIGFMRASGKDEYSIVKKAKAKIPTMKGLVKSELFKVKKGDVVSWIAREEPKVSWSELAQAMMSGKHSLVESADKTISLYAMGAVNEKSKAIPAVKELVLFEGMIEKSYDMITNTLRYIQEKYEVSPFFIEGFEVNLGINLSVKLIFKTKKK